MASYKLSVDFSNDDLETISATNSRIVIAKPSGNDVKPDVAWQAFDPLQANTLTWNEEYGIYASTANRTNGARLVQLSSVNIPATMNKLYTLEDTGKISGPSSGGDENSFSLLNSYSKQKYMTVGLFQDANVNGTNIIGNAISAAGVMHNSTAEMTPFTTVYIWIQSKVESNCVVTNVTSPMTKLLFGGGKNQLHVVFDADSGYFIPVASTNKMFVEHLAPAV